MIRAPQRDGAARRPGVPPILVTGGHRSGTTFVGKMLAASTEAAYVHVPFDSAERAR